MTIPLDEEIKSTFEVSANKRIQALENKFDILYDLLADFLPETNGCGQCGPDGCQCGKHDSGD